jgi:preprotein translocase subunit SecF
LALIIGFGAGAYSSIFIASTMLAWWRTRPGQLRPETASGPDSEDVLSDE